MTAPAKTVLGRALSSVRAMRQLAASDVAQMAGVGVGVVQTVETGRRSADGAMLRRILDALDATTGERTRVAEAMAAFGAEGGAVLYDLAPDCAYGRRAAALLSIYSASISDSTWDHIAALVVDDVQSRAGLVEVAA